MHHVTHQTNTIRNMKILNSREKKGIMQRLEKQFGFESDILDEYVFLMNKDNRIYIVSRNIENIPYDELKIDSIGMYFGELYNESLRLSIEASQLIGPNASKNIFDLTYDQMIEWIKGGNIDSEDLGRDFIIVKCYNKETKKSDYLGCGKYKDGKLMNYVSKSRKLVVVNN